MMPLPPGPTPALFIESGVVEVLAVLCLLIVAFLVFLILFEPGLEYKVDAPAAPVDSDRFARLLGALTDAALRRDSHVQVLTNGDQFYEAELEAIRSARSTINLEAYIFYKGEIGRRFLDALTERARAGVKVKLILDWIGSFTTWDDYFKDLRAAGGRGEWYQPVRWYTFKRFNNRTHREVMVVDGRVGFIGGAGIADQWFKGDRKQPRWRDTVVRVEGSLVVGLQTTFVENWLEAAGEVLSCDEYFPDDMWPKGQGRSEGRKEPSSVEASDAAQSDEEIHAGLVVLSAPSAGRSTRARVLFQTLLASARKTIRINSPYFLPDRSTRRELTRAAKERGVDVRIVTPGPHADHALTRSSGRRRFGELLLAGIRISEYQPAMIHAKVLIVDGVWSVVGSTNFDNRSFDLNDEVNLAAADRGLAKRLEEDFESDWRESRAITYEDWKRRPLAERLRELVGRLIERQQ
jgi:cardiolipin synthase